MGYRRYRSHPYSLAGDASPPASVFAVAGGPPEEAIGVKVRTFPIGNVSPVVASIGAKRANWGLILTPIPEEAHLPLPWAVGESSSARIVPVLWSWGQPTTGVGSHRLLLGAVF
jgi:hypothetical protein